MHKISHDHAAPVGGSSSSDAPERSARQRPLRRIVLKLGTRLLTAGTTRLDPARMEAVARAVSAAGPAEVVIVSSGAVAAGFRALGHSAPPARTSDRQAAAAVGQSRLMSLWDEAFRAQGRDVAQVLLTNDCLTDRRRWLAARHALITLLQAGVVPIVNENDAVAVEEIAVGDNDTLAAMSAALVEADLLALLTDVAGVFRGHPDDPAAELVREARSAADLHALCFKKTSPESKGGMVTKLQAAERAGRYGIPTVIASGTDQRALTAVLRGGAAGTLISASEHPLRARRHWMAVQRGLGGAVVVDEGALEAIRRRASLLPSGVVDVRGRFRRGDLVAVVDSSGVEHARGIVRFDDREVDRIRGLHTLDVKQALGTTHGHVVMRPDRMVLAGEEGRR